MNQNLENLVLRTLSFFEPMTFSQIILDFDNDQLKDFPSFDQVHLREIITLLEKRKLVKKVKLEHDVGWIKIYPKRSWWKRLFGR